MALGDPGDKPLHIPGNPSPSILGGDNRQDLGLNHIPGNTNPGMSGNLGDSGEAPYSVRGNPSCEELRAMFRGSN